jgi:thiamine monophosphate kinase
MYATFNRAAQSAETPYSRRAQSTNSHQVFKMLRNVKRGTVRERQIGESKKSEAAVSLDCSDSLLKSLLHKA